MAAYEYWQSLDKKEKESCIDRQAPVRDIRYKLHKLKAWQIQGKLAEEANLFKDAIRLKTIHENFQAQISPKNPSKATVAYEVYLVGKYDDVSELRLALVTDCHDIKYAKRACKLLEDWKKGQLAALLDDYELHYMQGSIRLCADAEKGDPTSGGDEHKTQTLCGQQIIIRSSSEGQQPSTATVGGTILLKGKPYALTTAHAFPGSAVAQRLRSPSPSNMIDRTSSDDYHENADRSSSDQADDLSHVQGLTRISCDVFAQNCSTNQVDPKTLSISEAAPVASNRINSKSGKVLLNRSQDWALIPIEHDKYTVINTVVCPDGSTFNVEKIADTSILPSDRVLLYTGLSEPAISQFSSSTPLLLIPGMDGLQKMWQAAKSSSPGDSGSWIIDHHRIAHAMIVAASPVEAIVYCLPLAPVAKAIQGPDGGQTIPSLLSTDSTDDRVVDLSAFPVAEYTSAVSSDRSSHIQSLCTDSDLESEGSQDGRDPLDLESNVAMAHSRSPSRDSVHSIRRNLVWTEDGPLPYPSDLETDNHVLNVVESIHDEAAARRQVHRIGLSYDEMSNDDTDDGVEPSPMAYNGTDEKKSNDLDKISENSAEPEHSERSNSRKRNKALMELSGTSARNTDVFPLGTSMEDLSLLGYSFYWNQANQDLVIIDALKSSDIDRINQHAAQSFLPSRQDLDTRPTELERPASQAEIVKPERGSISAIARNRRFGLDHKTKTETYVPADKDVTSTETRYRRASAKSEDRNLVLSQSAQGRPNKYSFGHKNSKHISYGPEPTYESPLFETVGGAARSQPRSTPVPQLAYSAHNNDEIVDIPQLSYQARAAKSKFSQFSRYDALRQISRDQIDPHILDALDIPWEWDSRNDYHITVPASITDEVINDLRKMWEMRDSFKKMKGETKAKLGQIYDQSDVPGKPETMTEANKVREREKTEASRIDPERLNVSKGSSPRRRVVTNSRRYSASPARHDDGYLEQRKDRLRGHATQSNEPVTIEDASDILEKATKRQLIIDGACRNLDLQFERDVQSLLRDEGVARDMCEKIIEIHNKKETSIAEFVQTRRAKASSKPPAPPQHLADRIRERDREIELLKRERDLAREEADLHQAAIRTLNGSRETGGTYYGDTRSKVRSGHLGGSRSNIGTLPDDHKPKSNNSGYRKDEVFHDDSHQRSESVQAGTNTHEAGHNLNGDKPRRGNDNKSGDYTAMPVQ